MKNTILINTKQGKITLRIEEPTIFILENIAKIFDEIKEEVKGEKLDQQIIEILQKEIFSMINVDFKLLKYFHLIINPILESFIEKKDQGGNIGFFDGILGVLAKFNNLDIKTFKKIYCLSDLLQLFNIREYHLNLENGKEQENNKFNRKEFTKEAEEKMEADIKNMLSEEDYKEYLKTRK